jgi:hypothetical protein
MNAGERLSRLRKNRARLRKKLYLKSARASVPHIIADPESTQAWETSSAKDEDEIELPNMSLPMAIGLLTIVTAVGLLSTVILY